MIKHSSVCCGDEDLLHVQKIALLPSFYLMLYSAASESIGVSEYPDAGGENAAKFALKLGPSKDLITIILRVWTVPNL